MEHIIEKHLNERALANGDEMLKKRNKILMVVLLGYFVISAIFLIILVISQYNQISFLNNQVKILNNNSINNTLFNEVVKCRMECGR